MRPCLERWGNGDLVNAIGVWSSSGRSGRSCSRTGELRLRCAVTNGSGVDAGAGRASGDEGTRTRELLVDDGLEGLEGLRTTKVAAIDEEAWSAACAEAAGDGLLCCDGSLVLVVVECCAELSHVEPKFFCVGVELRAAKGALVLEELRVHSPELSVAALLEGFKDSLSGRSCVVVEWKRVVHPDDANVVAVLFEDLVDRGLHAGAEGALEVRELDDGDESVVGTALWHWASRELELVDGGWVGLTLSRSFLLGGGGGCSGGCGETVAGHRLVDLGLRRASGNECASSCELTVHHLFELVVGLCAHELFAVDEERWGAASAEARCKLLVSLDLRLVLVVVERRAYLAHVETDLGGVSLKVSTLKGTLVLEEEVVHLPELVSAALFKGFESQVRSRTCVLVEGERVVAPDNAQVLTVLTLDALDGGTNATAEGALELGHDDHRDECVGRTLAGLVGGDGNAVALDVIFRARCVCAEGAFSCDVDVGDFFVATFMLSKKVAAGKPSDERDHDRDYC